MRRVKSILCGDLIRLRAVEPEDLDFLYRFENDSSLWSVGISSRPYSKYTLKHYIAQGASDIYIDGQMRLLINDLEKGEPVGTADLINFEPHHRRAEVGIAVTSEYRRKGYACEAVKLLEEYARLFLHLNQLYAYVGETNLASRRLFEKRGFTDVAVLSDWILTPDGYENVVLYQKKM